MVGTTRSLVSFFMNRFSNLGYIEYKDRIRVHKSLLNVILHDQTSERNAKAPPFGPATAHSISKADYRL
jgi:CRP/FNR family cyclic AMP-dependent transcriptional regulator